MQHVTRHGIKERFLPETIARDEQLLPPAVVNGEREHPIQAVETGWAELLVGVENGLRIRRRAEAMTLGFQQRPQRSMVVDLTVERDPAGLVLVRHRLMAAGAVDDGETTMPEHHARRLPEPV